MLALSSKAFLWKHQFIYVPDVSLHPPFIPEQDGYTSLLNGHFETWAPGGGCGKQER